MLRKIKWLAVAKYGTDDEKRALADNLRITPTPNGYRCSADIAFDNSLRGFYAEEIAKCYLQNRKCFTGFGYKWLDEGIVWERDDVAGPHTSEPDAVVICKDGTEATLDVKSNLRPYSFVDVDGTKIIRFSRTHNAQLILWYQPSTGLHVCKRLSPLYTGRDIWDEADYEELGVDEVKDFEVIVDEMLKTLA